MCGRFALTTPAEAVEEFFELAGVPPFPPRYNIAPTQPILVVLAAEAAAAATNRPARRALLARWGLWPDWAKDPRTFPLLFNARSESAATKPAFRNAMRHRRILVPASGFYEWKRPVGGSRARAQPYWIRPRAGCVVAFGGLLETWTAADGSEVDTAAILTTPANRSFAAIHPRMPLIVGRGDFARWLDCKTQEPKHVADLMRPPAEGLFEAVPVSGRVNNAANIGPDIQQPADAVDEAADDLTADPEQPTLF